MKTFKRLIQLGGCTYIGSSLALFYYPQLLHKPENHRNDINQGKNLIICAHRCGCYEGFENTVQAAGNAVLKGQAQMLEFDLNLSKDKIPVLHHDKAFVRTCSHGRFTTDFNFKDYPPLHKEINVEFALNKDKTSQFIYQRSDTDSKKINSLEELLQYLKKIDPENKVWLNFEFKSAERELFHNSYILLKQYGKLNRSIWNNSSSKEQEYLESYQKNQPKDQNDQHNLIKRCANSFDVIGLYLLYWTGLLPFTNIKFQSLQLPLMSDAYLFYKEKEHGKDSLTYKINTWVLWFMIKTSRPLFNHLHKRGVHIMFWVANEESDVYELLKYDGLIDGVITDRPQFVRQYLESKL